MRSALRSRAPACAPSIVLRQFLKTTRAFRRLKCRSSESRNLLIQPPVTSNDMAIVVILVVSSRGSHAACPNRKKHWTDWFGRRVPGAVFGPVFSAGAETVSRQVGGRAAVGGAGESSFHPAGRRTNRELEGRADLVGQQVQRRGEGGADPHL